MKIIKEYENEKFTGLYTVEFKSKKYTGVTQEKLDMLFAEIKTADIKG